MVQCEMCGAETSDPTTIAVEGAELSVCENCAQLGTTVETSQSSSGTSKYSTSGSGTSSGSNQQSSSQSSRSTSRSTRGDEMFDDVDEIAEDYDTRIRQAREDRGLSQKELAQQLNEKASLINKLERGSILPSDDVQRKLERELEISLTEDIAESVEEWEGESGPGEYTLGDVVQRKD